MSVLTRMPHNLSAPFACGVDFDWLHEHASCLEQYLHTDEDVAYVLSVLQSHVDMSDPRSIDAIISMASSMLGAVAVLCAKGVDIQQVDTQFVADLKRVA
jgi:hypothetical protein